MENKTFQDCVKSGFLGKWDSVARCTKPTIAAVNGFAVSHAWLVRLFPLRPDSTGVFIGEMGKISREMNEVHGAL